MSDSDRNLTVNIRLLEAGENKSNAEDMTKQLKQLSDAYKSAKDQARDFAEQTKKNRAPTNKDVVEEITRESEARRKLNSAHRETAEASSRASRTIEDAQRRAAQAAEDWIAELEKLNREMDAGKVVTYADAIARLEPKLRELDKATQDLTLAEEKHQRWLAIARSRNERHAAKEAEEAAAKAKRAEFERGRMLKLEQAQNRLNKANEAFLRTVPQMTNSLIQLGRSWVLLTVSNEENAVKAMQMIARFEAMAQGISGLIGLIKSASDMWKLYKVAVLAAAQADGIKALSGAAVSGGLLGGGGSAAKSGGSYAAAKAFYGGAGAAGGGLAARAGGLLIGGIGLAKTGAAAAAPAAGIAAGTAGLAGIGATMFEVGRGTYGQEGTFSRWGAERLNSVLPDWFGPGAGANAGLEWSQERLSRRTSQYASRFFQNRAFERDQGGLAVARAGLGLTGLDADRARLNEAFQQNQAQQAAYRMPDLTVNRFSNEEESKRLSGQRQVLEEAIRLEEEKHRLAVSTAQEEIAAAQERKNLSQITLNNLEKEKGLLVSEAERFVNMSPAERAKTMRAADRLQQGQELTPDDLRRVSQFSKFESEAERAYIESAQKLGGDKVITGLNKGTQLLDDYAQAKLDVEAKAEILVGLEESTREQLNQSRQQVDSAIEEILKAIEKNARDQKKVDELLEQMRVKFGQF